MAFFDARKPADWNLNRIAFCMYKDADVDHHEGNQTCSYGEAPFQYYRWIIFSNTSQEVLDQHDVDATINIDGFSMDLSLKKWGCCSFAWI